MISARVVSQPIACLFSGEPSAHLWIRAFHLRHLNLRQRAVLAVSGGFHLVGGDALFDQILLDPLDAAFAQVLVKRLGAANVA